MSLSRGLLQARAKLWARVRNGLPLGATGDRSTVFDVVTEAVAASGRQLMAGSKQLSMASVPPSLSQSPSSSPAAKSAASALRGPDALAQEGSVGGAAAETSWPLDPGWEWGARPSMRRKSIKKLAFTYCPVLAREVTDPDCGNDHALAAFGTPFEGYSCNSCHSTFPEGATMHGCRECDFDLCGACFERPRTKPATYRDCHAALELWRPSLSDFRAHFDPLAAVAASDWDVSALLRGTRLRLAEGSFAQAAPDMPLRPWREIAGASRNASEKVFLVENFKRLRAKYTLEHFLQER